MGLDRSQGDYRPHMEYFFWVLVVCLYHLTGHLLPNFVSYLQICLINAKSPLFSNQILNFHADNGIVNLSVIYFFKD